LILNKGSGNTKHLYLLRQHWLTAGGRHYPYQLQNNRATVMQVVGQWAKAGEIYRKNLAWGENSGDRKIRADSLYRIGELKRFTSDYPASLECLHQAIAIYEALNNREMIGKALGVLGMSLSQMGDKQSALGKNYQSLDIARETGDIEAEGKATGKIGLIYSETGEYPKALEHIQRQLDIARKTDQIREQGIALGNLGNVYWKQGLHLQAMDCYREKLELSRKIGVKAGIGTTLGNMGLIYKQRGEYGQALEHYQAFLDISRELGDRRSAGMAIGNMGVVYLEQQQYQKARDCFEQRMLISREIGDRSGIANMHCNIGLVEMNLECFRPALDHFNAFLEGCLLAGDRHNQAMAYHSLGECYHRMGKLQEAEGHYLSAVKLGTGLGDGYYLPTYRLGLAEIYFSLGLYDRSKTEAEQALALNSESGPFKNILPLTILLAKLEALTDVLNAGKLLHQLLKTHQQPYQQAEIFYQIYLITRDAGDRDKALQSYRQAQEDNPLPLYQQRMDELRLSTGSH
jgi:tetratricopeptide (TPR) repeat protein